MHAFAFVFALHFGGVKASGGDRWFSGDKAMHFFTAAFVQGASFGGLRATGLNRNASLAGASAFTGAVSIGKELFDLRTGGDPSLKDLTWDAVGMGSMSLLLRRTTP